MRESATFDRNVIAEIQRAAREGIYDIRGFGAKRPVPHFDDLLFLGASMSRYPLEGYRERCDTDVTLGARHAKKPLHLDIPITIAGMSFGALSANGQAIAAMTRQRLALHSPMRFGKMTAVSGPFDQCSRTSPAIARFARARDNRRLRA